MRLGYVLLGLVALTSIHTSCGQCSNGFAGVQKDDICCDAACGTCGGGGCGRLPGGQENCCTSRVKESGMMCSDTQAAPCIVENESVCSNGFPGVQKGDICCGATCGTCGGSDCGSRLGGSEACCTSRISESGMMCDTTMAAPCIVNPISNPGDVCSNGLQGVQSGDICCDSSCGTCGGSGCGTRPGGSSSCCTSRIRSSAGMCDTTLTAPCIVNEDSPRPGCLSPTSRTYKCSFSGSTSLLFEECDLSDRDVPFLPECFEAFGRTNIQRLDFEGYMSITAFPEDTFAGMSELTILQMDNNRLTTVPEGLFAGLTKLEVLDMSANLLVNLPEAIFSDLASLQTLNLNENDLSPETLPIGLFAGVPLLQELRLSRNALEDVTDLEGLVDGLTELTSLELGGDELLLNANSFTGFENLESLSLHFDIPLTLPEGLFSGLGALRILKLRSEPLLLYEDVFVGLVGLERLDIGSNRLTTLHAGVFSPMVNLVEIDFSHNRDLQCLPFSTATDIVLESEDIRDGTCECTPEEAVVCDDGFTCQSGMTGYTCVAE